MGSTFDESISEQTHLSASHPGGSRPGGRQVVVTLSQTNAGHVQPLQTPFSHAGISRAPMPTSQRNMPNPIQYRAASSNQGFGMLPSQFSPEGMEHHVHADANPYAAAFAGKGNSQLDPQQIEANLAGISPGRYDYNSFNPYSMPNDFENDLPTHAFDSHQFPAYKFSTTHGEGSGSSVADLGAPTAWNVSPFTSQTSTGPSPLAPQSVTSNLSTASHKRHSPHARQVWFTWHRVMDNLTRTTWLMGVLSKEMSRLTQKAPGEEDRGDEFIIQGLRKVEKGMRRFEKSVREYSEGVKRAAGFYRELQASSMVEESRADKQYNPISSMGIKGMAQAGETSNKAKKEIGIKSEDTSFYLATGAESNLKPGIFIKSEPGLSSGIKDSLLHSSFDNDRKIKPDPGFVKQTKHEMIYSSFDKKRKIKPDPGLLK